MQRQAEQLRGWRWIPSEQWHLTLRFFGACDDRIAQRLEQALESASRVSSLAPLELAGVGVFPSRGAARILWCGVEGELDRLGNCVAQLEDVAQRLGFAPELRPLKPHLTVARARAREQQPDRPAATSERFGQLAIDRLLLLHSELRPAGATYRLVRSWPLGAEGDRCRA